MNGFADRAALETLQRDALGPMIRELARFNRFYRPRLEAAGLECGPLDLDDYFARMPFTFKHELVEDQRLCPPYGTIPTWPLDRYTRFHQTSGTRDSPLRWLDTPESWSWMVDNWVEVFQVSGVIPGDRIFFPFSFGPFLGFWTAFEAGSRLGCLCLPGGGMSSVARLKILLENEATVLCCTPTYALRLADVAREERIDLRQSCVKTILVAGEPGGAVPSVRDLIERSWPGASVRDHHGMTEVGPVSYECPARPGTLHVIERSFIAEVVDPESGKAVERGGEGELTLTNLGRVGSPLLRYRTGDRVKRGSELVCACGRSDLALEGGILGRWDDMVIVRGVNLTPGAIDEVLRRFDEIAEYRATVMNDGSMLDLNIELEATPECADPPALARAVETTLRASFHLRLPVSLATAGSLPRFEMKAKRWIDSRTPSL